MRLIQSETQIYNYFFFLIAVSVYFTSLAVVANGGHSAQGRAICKVLCRALSDVEHKIIAPAQLLFSSSSYLFHPSPLLFSTFAQAHKNYTQRHRNCLLCHYSWCPCLSLPFLCFSVLSLFLTWLSFF